MISWVLASSSAGSLLEDSLPLPRPQLTLVLFLSLSLPLKINKQNLEKRKKTPSCTYCNACSLPGRDRALLKNTKGEL